MSADLTPGATDAGLRIRMWRLRSPVRGMAEDVGSTNPYLPRVQEEQGGTTDQPDLVSSQRWWLVQRPLFQRDELEEDWKRGEGRRHRRRRQDEVEEGGGRWLIGVELFGFVE